MGFGLASFFSDLSHEVATTLLPLFLASLGAPAYSIGIIEGIADGLASVAKFIGGWVSDRFQNRKILAGFGYLLTGSAMGFLGFATHWFQALIWRSAAWLGRGWRQPIRDALFHDAVTPETSGRAFGFERMMDTAGAVIAPVVAFIFLPKLGFENLFKWTWIPGLLSVFCFLSLVKDHRHPKHIKNFSFREGLRQLSAPYRHYLAAVTLFGLSDFSHSIIIFWVGKLLAPIYGAGKASGIAILLYAFHNVIYAIACYPAGYIADKIGKFRVLVFGYFLAAVMYLGFIFAKGDLGILFLLFFIRGVYVAIEDTLERVIAGDLLTPEIKGTGYGVLASVNGFGDLLSSVVVGFLMSTSFAFLPFGYCFLLALGGTLLLLRVSREYSR